MLCAWRRLLKTTTKYPAANLAALADTLLGVVLSSELNTPALVRTSKLLARVLQRLRYVKGVQQRLTVPWRPLRALLRRQLFARTRTYESEGLWHLLLHPMPRLAHGILMLVCIGSRLPTLGLKTFACALRSVAYDWQSGVVSECTTLDARSISSSLRCRPNDAAAGGGRRAHQASAQAAALLPSRHAPTLLTLPEQALCGLR